MYDILNRIYFEIFQISKNKVTNSLRISLGIECPHRGAAFSYEHRFVKYPYVENEREACNVFFVWELFRPILQGLYH